MPGFEKLSLQQQKLVYYLSEAGYAGRDIIWDQNYHHNLSIRRTLEKIINEWNGNRTLQIGELYDILNVFGSLMEFTTIIQWINLHQNFLNIILPD